MTSDSGAAKGLVDLGLQLERTALAWRRTALAVAAAAVGGARALVELRADEAAAAVGAGLSATALVAWLAARRYAAGRRAWQPVDRLPAGAFPALPGALPLALVAAAQLVAGLVVAVLLLA